MWLRDLVLGLIVDSGAAIHPSNLLEARPVSTTPFAILGVTPGLELSDEELETRYLQLSRECHPDFNQGLEPTAQLEMLGRAAALNDAYRVLRDPWRRAAALLQILDPAAMAATKTLCPMFLLEAMEVREAIEHSSADQWPRLRADTTRKVDQYFRDVARHIAAGELRQAATLLHQSNYYRKALQDLRERIHAA